jgi:hypothetical protein
MCAQYKLIVTNSVSVQEDAASKVEFEVTGSYLNKSGSYFEIPDRISVSLDRISKFWIVFAQNSTVFRNSGSYLRKTRSYSEVPGLRFSKNTTF